MRIKKVKQVVSLLLIAVLVLSLAACSRAGSSETENGKQAVADTTGFRVGFGKADITPQESVPLGGYGNTLKRMSTGFMEYIYSCCVAITDEKDNTVLLLTFDLLEMREDTVAAIRKAVSEATGVAEDHIMCSASHTHSGPDLTQNKVACISRYEQLLLERTAEAAAAAMQDRRQAEMEIAAVETEGLNFVRRYVLENGAYAGDNYGDFSAAPIKDHESKADGTMQLIKFVREDAKDVLMTNWQCHPHRGGGGTNLDITSDLVGVYREAVETALDCHVAYWQGGAGNINPSSRIKEENVTADYREQGKALADYAVKAEGTYTKVETGDLVLQKRNYQGKVDHSDDSLASVARQVQSVWNSSGNYSKSMEVAEGTAVSSPYHANAIVAKTSLGETIDCEFNALSIGDVAFVTAPYEMFDSNAMAIKENSPYAMTFVAAYSNGSIGYVASEMGFAHGGYEADVCRVVEGSGEEFAGVLLDMLDALKTGN